jgi:hypothetical protein
VASDLDLNIRGDARRAQAALNDVASGSARAARITDQLARSFDHLESEANEAQRALDRVNDEIANNGPSAELSAELERLQRRLADVSNERFDAERLRAGFRNSTAAAAQLDNQLGDVRRELQRLNSEYARSGDPAVLRQIERQQQELARLQATRRRIADEDVENQHRLARLAEEAHRAQLRRDEEERRNNENNSLLARLGRRALGAGNGVGNGLQGMPTPVLGSAGAALGAAAAVPLLSALGGALTGLAGFGVAGAGIAGAIMGDPDKFKAEWASAADTVKEEFLGATEVFTGPTLEAIRDIGPLVESWDLDDMFANAAKYVDPLVDGLGGLASGILRGVSAMVDKGEPAVLALSEGLIELGDAAGDAFSDIADGAEGGAAALRDTITVVAGIVRAFGAITEAAEDTYTYIQDHPVEAAIGSGGISLGITLLGQFEDQASRLGPTLDSVGESGTTAFYGIDQAERDALATVERLNDEFNETRDVLLGVSNAEIAVANDLRDLTEAFRENGATIDINTQKGADNLSMINRTIEDLKRQRDAAIAAGGGTQEAYDAATAAYNQQLANLERLIAKTGIGAEAARRLMESYYSKEVTVTVRVRQVGNVSVEGVVSGGDQRRNAGSAYAEGGTVTGTGPMLVGEEGPEIVWGNMGQFVSTAAQTQRLVSQMSRSGPAAGQTAGVPSRLVVSGGGEFGTFIQKLVDTGQIQLFVNGQAVTAR